MIYTHLKLKHRLIISVPGECYSRNACCVLNLYIFISFLGYIWP